MSQNKPIIDSLILTQQGKDAKLYELLRKTSQDLDEVYKNLLEGPLPEASAENLTNIPAGEIVGIIGDANLPTNIPRLNTTSNYSGNIFVRINLGGYFLGWSTASSYGRFQTVGDGDFLLSGNLFYSGGWGRDTGGLGGSGVRFYNGNTYFYYYDGTLKQNMILDNVGIIHLGAPASVAGSASGEAVLANGRNLRATNVAGNSTYPLIGLNGDDQVVLGSGFTSSGRGHIAIPRDFVGDLPSGGGTKDGTLVIDKSNNRLCYYSNGNRYYLSGIAF